MSRPPFIAIGTGRCGSVSLSKIIDACVYVRCSHEAFVTNWYNPKPSKLQKLKKFLEKSFSSATMYGEVQPHLLPHIPQLINWIPDLKIICLHRPCEEVVSSFMKRGPDKLRPSARENQINSKWVDRLPDIEAHSADDAVRYYWDMYEKFMAEMEGAFHIEMEELNSDKKIVSLFDFLEIEEEHRVFIDDRLFNAS